LATFIHIFSVLIYKLVKFYRFWCATNPIHSKVPLKDTKLF
jgi:hypothetical protein